MKAMWLAKLQPLKNKKKEEEKEKMIKLGMRRFGSMIGTEIKEETK